MLRQKAFNTYPVIDSGYKFVVGKGAVFPHSFDVMSNAPIHHPRYHHTDGTEEGDVFCDPKKWQNVPVHESPPKQ